jgi:hypothetical protein
VSELVYLEDPIYPLLMIALNSPVCIWLAASREMKADSMQDDGNASRDQEPPEHPLPNGPRLESLDTPVLPPSKHELYRRALSLLTDDVLNLLTVGSKVGVRNFILGMGTKTRLLKKLGMDEEYNATYVLF